MAGLIVFLVISLKIKKPKPQRKQQLNCSFQVHKKFFHVHYKWRVAEVLDKNAQGFSNVFNAS